MTQKSEAFRNWAAGAQATVIALIAVGGVRFASLQYGNVELDLSTSALGEVENGCLMEVSIDVTNTTTRDAHLVLSKTPVRVFRMTSIQGGQPSFAIPLKAPVLASPDLKDLQPIENMTLPAGQMNKIGGLVVLPVSGVYWFEVSLTTDRGLWQASETLRLRESCTIRVHDTQAVE